MKSLMSAAKKRKSGLTVQRLAKLIRFLRGPGRPLTILAAMAAAIAVASWLVRPIVQEHLRSSEEYLAGPGQIHIITPKPEWIKADIRTEVFQNTGLDQPLSILDDNAAEQVGNALALHPWVAKVSRVSKHHPARFDVELLYRRPVCMVEVSGRLYPVDRQGVLLPGNDFSLVEAARYPKLVGIDKLPVGTLGENWGDGRVLGGAEIAAELLPFWQEWKLSRIMPSPPSAKTVAGRRTYTLTTQDGTRVIWGCAPSTETPGEFSAAEKIALLEHYIAEHGTLDGGPKELDVNRLELPRVSSRPESRASSPKR